MEIHFNLLNHILSFFPILIMSDLLACKHNKKSFAKVVIQTSRGAFGQNSIVGPALCLIKLILEFNEVPRSTPENPNA